MAVPRRHRYLLRETLVPTGLGLAIFTFVLLMGRMLKLVELVVTKGVPGGEVLKLFLYLLPSFLVLTLPLAFLLGILLGFGRLSADSEITALKATGVSLYDMTRPILILALAISLATGILTLYAQPLSKAAFKRQVFEIARSRASIGIQPRVFNDEFTGLVLYADRIEEKTGRMTGLFISDERQGKEPAVIVARSGRTIPDLENLSLVLRLENGAIHRSGRRTGEDVYQIIEFATYDIQLDLGAQLQDARERRKKEGELTLPELRREIAERQRRGDPEAAEYQVEFHQRLIMPFAPLLFALIGIPLGIQNQRAGKGGGFALALLVFLGYYLVFSFAETLGSEAVLPPALVMWTPNLLFLLAGIYLLHLSAREKRLFLLARAAVPGQWLKRLLRSRGGRS